MSHCPDILQLQALADGQCCELEARALTDHVAACPACAENLRELRLACLPLDVLTEAPPADLERRLHEAVRDVRPLPALACEEALEWASWRLDGALAHEQAQRLEAHLLACGPCYRAATEMETAAAVLRATEPEAAPAGLLARVQAAAELAAPVRIVPVRPPLLRRWGMGLAGVAAAAALFLAVLTHSLAPVTQAPVPVVATAPAAPTVVATAPSPALVGAASSRDRTVSALPAAPPSRPAATGTPAPRTVMTAPPAVPRTTPPAPAHNVAPPRLPASTAGPSEVALEPRTPAAVALVAPVLPEARPGQPSLEMLPATRTDVAPPASPRAAPSGPARVAADVPKPTPPETPAQPAAAPATARSRSRWVSRPVSAEREIYKSDDVSNRLADARGELARDAREVTLFRSPGYAITH